MQIIDCKVIWKWQRLFCISVTIWPLRSVISHVKSLKKTSAIDLKRATDKLSDVHLFNATKNLVGPTTLNCLISFLIRFSSSTCIEKDFFHILETKNWRQVVRKYATCAVCQVHHKQQWRRHCVSLKKKVCLHFFLKIRLQHWF